MKESKKISFYVSLVVVFILGLFLYSEYSFKKTYLVKSRYSTDLPIVSQEEKAVTSIKLFYYNQKKDTDNTGNVLCSEQGIESVSRVIPASQTPLKDTLDLLLRGQFTDAEKQSGVSTEFPLEGVFIQSIALGDDGILLVDLRDPLRKTVGGSCRASILARQIIYTAKQFEAVKQVEFVSREVFQP